MKVIQIENSGKVVARKWKNQYFRDGTWYDPKDADAEQIYNALLSSKSAKKMDEIIGNQSWTRPWCSECMEYCDTAIVFCEVETTAICKDCLKKSIKLLK